MSRENVELARGGCEAWARGDFEAAYALWDADVEWHTTRFEAWPENAVYRGREEIQRFLAEEWLASWDDFEIELEDVIDAGDDRVVVFWRQRMVGRESGVPVELRSAQIHTVRDGKTVRIENYTDRDEALRDAGLPGPQHEGV